MSVEAGTTYFGRSRTDIEREVVATENVVCPLCGIEPEAFATDYQGFRLCRCRKCRLEFVSPRLSYDQLAETVYSRDYFPPRLLTSELPLDAVHYFSRQLAAYERLVEGTGPRMLDVGCGNGAFLDFARENGWRIAGLDIMLSRDARRLECLLWEGRLENIDFGKERFDVVRLNHVLEHAQDPVADLSICRDLILPGGLLHLSVPNLAGLSPRLKSLQSRLRLKAHRWRHYAAMHHLFFFTPHSLRAVVGAAGLEVVELKTPVPKKAGQSAIVDRLSRTIMESTNTSSILDVYCRPI